MCAMASSSYTLSLPLQLPRYATSARRGLGALNNRASPSARLQTTTATAKGLRSVAATSYQHEAAGHGDSGGSIDATTSALRLVAGDDELRAAAGTRSPKGRPGKPREGSGGAGGKVHATPPTLLRVPKEGAGGQGGSIH